MGLAIPILRTQKKQAPRPHKKEFEGAAGSALTDLAGEAQAAAEAQSTERAYPRYPEASWGLEGSQGAEGLQSCLLLKGEPLRATGSSVRTW